MKCLCCEQSSSDLNSLKEHYVLQHGIDENNYVFRKLFTRDRVFVPKKCFRCRHFCFSGRNEKNHNFLLHYQQGGSLPIADKPLEKTDFDENLQKYCIIFHEHCDYYNFYDSQEIVSQFLTVFENNFLPRLNLRKVRFKCFFMLINRQPPLHAGMVEHTVSRV